MLKISFWVNNFNEDCEIFSNFARDLEKHDLKLCNGPC